MRSLRLVLRAVLVVVSAGSMCAGQTVNVQAGKDHWKTQSGFVFFGGAIPPIPAGFFGPGSDPFLGTVQLTGTPASPAKSNADTIVQRNTDALLAPPVSSTSIPVQLVELSLKSINPIMVTSNGGQSPQPWIVNVGLAPVPQTGTMNVTRTQSGGGTFASQFIVQPRFVFTRVSDGIEIPYTAGSLNTSTQGSASWVVTPFATPLIPESGPNFYSPPAVPWTVMSSGGFQQVLVPATGTDCNGNGIIDSAELLAGTSLDSNLNGILDECEASVALRQISWPDFGAGFVQRFSSTGDMRITYVEPPMGTILWFSAAINGVQVVENLPLGEVNGEGMTTQMHVMFDLGVTPGTIVLTRPVVFRISTTQQTTIPVGTPQGVAVTEKLFAYGYMNPNEIVSPPDPPTAVAYVNPADGVIWDRVERRNVGMVDEAVDGCAPGSGGRCLDWMNHLYCLGFPADCDTAQEIYAKLYMLMHTRARMGMTPGGTDPAEAVNGLKDLIAMKGLSASLMVSVEDVSDPSKIYLALQQGKDVIGVVQTYKNDGTPNGWHAITVTGITICGPKYEIEYRDDSSGSDNQGDGSADSGCKSEKLVIGPDGKYHVENFPKNAFTFFIQICPSPFIQQKALTKWIDGDGTGGMIEGAKSLIDRVIGGYMPTIADRGNMKAWLCNALDVASYQLAMLQATHAPANVIAAALDMKNRLAAAKASFLMWFNRRVASGLSDASNQLGVEFHNDETIVRDYTDCNHNGIDDQADIAGGLLHDANHDNIPDNCECLADWNHDGVKNVADIFAYLAAWFQGGGDFNHDGQHTVSDIFFFLSAWFAGC